MAHRIGSKAWVAARNAKIAKAMKKKWAERRDKKKTKKIVLLSKSAKGRSFLASKAQSFLRFPTQVNGRKATISIPVTITFQ